MPCLERWEGNPILTREDIPDIPPDLVDVTSVFNPGATMHGERFLLLLRVQTRARETFLLRAESDDGADFEVAREPVALSGLERLEERIYHVYDPRITRLGDRFLVIFAADVEGGSRLGTASTRDFRSFELLGLGAGKDIRNGVLFPEPIGGRTLRLYRPNRVELPFGPTTGDEIRLSESDDLVHWRDVGPVLKGRPHYWDELIGSGPPPVKTRAGWLHIYHGVATHVRGSNIYQAGVALLDLGDPTRVIARGHSNILEPREPYELIGQLPNVVFPTGMIAGDLDGEGFASMGSKVYIYYGAADTSVALATTTIERLIAACHE
ncbi:MAG: glycoside hydrolase family 130 protein [Planctomycetota bacterium]